MIFSSGFRRSATVMGGVVLSVVVAACSGGSGAESGSPSSENQSTGTSDSQSSSGVDIANPKDAAAGKVCDLLTAEAAQTVGVQSGGEKQEESLTLPEGAPNPCVWRSNEGSTRVSFTPLSDRSIQQYYDNPDAYVDFEKLKVSGYPAVRANKDDPMTGGSCDIFLASKQNQVVKSTSFIPSEDVGKVNPCDLSKKALELSVSSWPAVK